MLEKYFSAPKTLRRLRSGISGPHIDAFADDLEREGYALASAVRYIRAAAHLGCFVQRRGGLLAEIDFNTLHAFVGHLRSCRCPHYKRAKIAYHARFGVKLFHQRLVGCGICPSEPVREAERRSSSCHCLPRLVSNASRGEAANASAVRSRRRGVAPGPRRGCRSMDCACRTQLSSTTCQPVWSSDHTEADYLPPGVSAVSQLPW